MEPMYLTLGEVSRLLAVRPYQIDYALKVGLIEEPVLRIGNKRIFQGEDVARLKQYFNKEQK